MRAQILVSVEDSNEFELNEPLAGVQPFTIGHRKHKRHIARVDKLRAGASADLPPTQAENLIRLGYAKAI